MKNKDILGENEILRKQIEFVLGATRTGLDIIDSNFNIVFIDAEWAKVYGDWKGKKCYDYFMGRGDVCPGCGVKRAFETKSVVVTDEILAREGNRSVRVTTIPFQNEKGEWLVAEVNVDMSRVVEADQMKEKIKELEFINRITMDREERILELKEEIKRLKAELKSKE